MIGRSEKYFYWIIFLVKIVCFMHVLRWLGVGRAEKNFKVGIFLNKTLLGLGNLGYRKQATVL